MKYETDKSVYYYETLKGASEIVESYGMFIKAEFRGQGFALEENTRRLHQLRRDGHSYVICTVNSMNHPQVKTLNRNKWKRLAVIKSFYPEEAPIFLYGRKLERLPKAIRR